MRLTKIDLATWDRGEYFSFYKGLDFPYINIGARIDVTNLKRFARARGLSSYLTLIHTAHMTAHEIVNFRYRIIDGEPALLDKMGLTFTYMPPDSELFINVIVEYARQLAGFHETAQARRARPARRSGVDHPGGPLRPHRLFGRPLDRVHPPREGHRPERGRLQPEDVVGQVLRGRGSHAGDTFGAGASRPHGRRPSGPLLRDDCRTASTPWLDWRPLGPTFSRQPRLQVLAAAARRLAVEPVRSP